MLDISARMELKQDMEYMLVVKLKSGDGRSASYYTRVVVNDNYLESQLLNAAKDFLDATFAYDMLESESVIGTYKQEYTGV